MKIYKALTKRAEYVKFDRNLKNILFNLPTVERYQQLLLDEWFSIGRAKLKADIKTIKKVLPLKSLVIGSDYGYGRYVEFNTREFNIVMYKRINAKLYTFINYFYDSHDVKIRKFLYHDNKETFSLLVDAVNENYHSKNETDVLKLINFLEKEFKEHLLVANGNKSSVDYRMKIELEFINKREEANKLKI